MAGVEQATLTGATKRESARSSRRKASPQGKKGQYTVYFSTEGAAFRSWWEDATGVKLDETAANARACNSLGPRESVTEENTRLVAKEIKTNPWVKKNRVSVTVQDLADDDSKLRWEKWLTPAQQRKHEPVTSVTELTGDDQYNPRLLAQRQALTRRVVNPAALTGFADC